MIFILDVKKRLGNPKEEIALINQNSVKAFTRAIGKVRRSEQDTHTLQNGYFSTSLCRYY